MNDVEPRVAVVSTVKAPLGLLFPWINHHRGVGFGRFYLFLDDPDDPAIESLVGLEDVTTIPCGPAWWKAKNGDRPRDIVSRQLVNLHEGIEAARADGFDWVAHIDCDELVRPLSPLARVLNGNPADALRMAVREAVSERMDYRHIFDARTFRVPPDRPRWWAARLLGCRHSIRHGEYFRGHRESKSLIRTDGRVRRMGVHKPRECEAGARVVWTDELQLLHFDCVGFDDWNVKWSARLEGDSFGPGMRPSRKAQFADFAEAATQGMEARRALFRETQMIPPREAAILRRLGLLETIDFDRTRIKED